MFQIRVYYWAFAGIHQIHARLVDVYKRHIVVLCQQNGVGQADIADSCDGDLFLLHYPTFVFRLYSRNSRRYKRFSEGFRKRVDGTQLGAQCSHFREQHHVRAVTGGAVGILMGFKENTRHANGAGSAGKGGDKIAVST